MGHYFKALPVKLEFSNSGTDAISKCQSKKFDLILMDLQMNEMGGIEAARQIRTFEKETPIFAMTNVEPTPDEESQATSAGCTRYFSKGLTKEALQDQVSQALFGELLLA
jgi:CheY-like chemotaxis protein